MQHPNLHNLHPMAGFPQISFLKNTVSNPNIVIGDYTYYDDPIDSENFERNVLYHFPFVGDRLIIGRFCALSRGLKFIMNGANHKMSGFSAYPFEIFGESWTRVMPRPGEYPDKGDTVVGNDVWIGYEAVIMPGVKIGDGAIVASKSIVTKDVSPYTIVGGNPAGLIRQRFSDSVVQTLLELAWWHWDIDKITRNLEKIVGADIEALKTCV
ncbi:Vat family streptogramin A O-acetyltransferase [Romeria aff. gracilis LEGE 07310]|uniref:Vat family streptogramin A O-acetyltransferase n=1 Tax=Vasconcelosia minhoensis LEGE 07310 TaxID=915328 RepID=A0A8J7DDW4_9CYAN|nr:Vat family streptogramin A O-acetyltransferase [Romeria gracilis]MBE9079223.1 Vat family streptogramin A O-acetyltransferase [Romeria aff. gracilis LEGE 07310]